MWISTCATNLDVQCRIMVEIIVIPDVHGRTFWKDAIAKREENTHIVFLGDYLDPYETENISYEEALANFKEILKFKETHHQNTSLLLGNHDIHYISTYPNGRSTRYDNVHASEIAKLLNDNHYFFEMMFTARIGDKTFVFSHAGINKLWVFNSAHALSIDCKNEQNAGTRIDGLPVNEMFRVEAENNNLFYILSEVSYLRGGMSNAGSMIWEDVSAYENEEPYLPNLVQVFGHTQMKSSPINIRNSYYDLDVRRGFMINSNGEVCELDGTVIPRTV